MYPMLQRILIHLRIGACNLSLTCGERQDGLPASFEKRRKRRSIHLRNRVNHCKTSPRNKSTSTTWMNLFILSSPHWLSFHPIATSLELGGVGCKAVPEGRSVQPCGRRRQVGSLRTGGKGVDFVKELQQVAISLPTRAARLLLRGDDASWPVLLLLGL